MVPTTADEWAEALDSELWEAYGGSISDQISHAYADEFAGGVSILSGEQAVGLDDNQIGSADGRLLATWDERTGYWTGRDVAEASWLTVSAPVGDGSWQVISRDPADDQSMSYLLDTHSVADLHRAELSAHDLGCEPGTVYRVALLDNDDREISAVEVSAR